MNYDVLPFFWVCFGVYLVVLTAAHCFPFTVVEEVLRLFTKVKVPIQQ